MSTIKLVATTWSPKSSSARTALFLTHFSFSFYSLDSVGTGGATAGQRAPGGELPETRFSWRVTARGEWCRGARFTSVRRGRGLQPEGAATPTAWRDGGFDDMLLPWGQPPPCAWRREGGLPGRIAAMVDAGELLACCRQASLSQGVAAAVAGVFFLSFAFSFTFFRFVLQNFFCLCFRILLRKTFCIIFFLKFLQKYLSTKFKKIKNCRVIGFLLQKISPEFCFRFFFKMFL